MRKEKIRYFAANKYEGCSHDHKTKEGARRCALKANKKRSTVDDPVYRVYTRIPGVR